MLELAAPKFEAAGVSDRIEVLVGSATDSIQKLLQRGERFDIAFLDADKTGYLGYYKQLMDNQLINPGGIIVVDNALMKVCQPGLSCITCVCRDSPCRHILLTSRSQPVSLVHLNSQMHELICVQDSGAMFLQQSEYSLSLSLHSATMSLNTSVPFHRA